MYDYKNDIYPIEPTPVIKEILDEAHKLNTPIVQFESINLMIKYIKIYKIKHILEIGSAIGYSAIMLASYTDVKIITIERDEQSFLRAVKNVKKAKLESKIKVIHSDALIYEPEEDYKCDLLFIDAAKASYIRFFDRFSPYVKIGGMVITDNVLFHGLVEHPSKIKSKRIKQLVRKITAYNKYILSLDNYESYLYHIGDGLLISYKKR